MNIVYLIGNGFDINLGLKTRFTDFYKYYLKQNSTSPIIKEFKNRLNGAMEKWADLEITLGEYTKFFTKETVNLFMDLVYDIQDNLATYIKQQVPNIKLSETDEQKLSTELFSPNMYFNNKDTAQFLEYKSKYKNSCDNIVNIINFNYSPTIERLLSYKNKSKVLGTHIYYNVPYKNILNSITHIHGTTEENMVLGVNDISQIKNIELRNIKKIRALLIKPETNKYAGTLREINCKNQIEEADVICIFGMSLGATDKIWWQAILDKLSTSNACLIIFDVNNKQISNLRKYLLEFDKDEIKSRLLSFSNFNDTEKSYISNKIFVYFNSEIFNISNISQSKYDDFKNVLEKAVNISS